MATLESLRRFARLRILVLALGAAIPALALAQPPSAVAARPGVAQAGDRKFTTSPTLSREAATLVRLLDEAHLNHAAVHSADYADIIPDYMKVLDRQHLFFLAEDEAGFDRRYGKNVYYNTLLGNIDAAYEIFYRYESRMRSRVLWIDEALKKPFDFTADETYAVDRTSGSWPSNAAEADDLWRRRLKYELINEMIAVKIAEGKKTEPGGNVAKADKTVPDAKVGAPAPAAAPLSPIDQAKQVVRDRYDRMLKNLDQFEGGDLAEEYLTCIAERYDPHSAYLSADSLEEFGINMKLELVGIGAMLELDQQDEYCTVLEVVPGGPADLGRQLKPDDRIISVAQEAFDPAKNAFVTQKPVEIIGMKLRKVVDMIRGPQGTRVHLMVLPAGAHDASLRKEIVITRDKVKLDSARAHAAVFQVPGPAGKPVSIGVISLPAFYGAGDDSAEPGSEQATASQDVARLIGQLRGAGIQGLVLDLRDNGGGFLSEAINLAGLFIRPGPVVQVRNSEGQIQVDDDDYPAPIYEGPLAVLVDRFSASASEIVAGALQNYGRAIVVGDKSTHGKGTVQTIIEMKNLPGVVDSDPTPAPTGAAKITIQKFYLPSGASTQCYGVTSDIALPSVDDYLPIGESDLPHALIWDRIRSEPFDGAPIDPAFLAALKRASQARQSQLPEFAFLKKSVDWLRARQDEKLVSLNLIERLKEQADDTAFRHEMNAERNELAKSDYSYREFRLGPPPQKLQPAGNSGAQDEDDQDNFEPHDPENYSKVDVHLRETLRILDDAIQLGREHQYWVSNHPPLALAENGS